MVLLRSIGRGRLAWRCSIDTTIHRDGEKIQNVALYDWLDAIDTVDILALRHQREAGYE